jgi:SAM-dependent methyltransferase
MSEFDSLYSQNPDFFGSDPHPLLTQFGNQIPTNGRVLDIGTGQGRNALPLARLGLQVTGIDTSGTSIQIVRETAERENLPVSLWQGSFMDYQPDAPFVAIACFGLFQILPRQTIASLLYRLQEWTQPGGLLFLTAWHVDDPDYDRVHDSWQEVNRHSFRDIDGRCRTYLGRGEVLDLLLGWRVIHLWEGLGPEHRHADGPVERHGDVEVVAEKLDLEELERILRSR